MNPKRDMLLSFCHDLVGSFHNNSTVKAFFSRAAFSFFSRAAFSSWRKQDNKFFQHNSGILHAEFRVTMQTVEPKY